MITESVDISLGFFLTRYNFLFYLLILILLHIIGDPFDSQSCHKISVINMGINSCEFVIYSLCITAF